MKDEKDRILKGFFYSHELVAINLSDQYRAKKVGEEVVDGKKFARIQYLDYPKEFDEMQLISNQSNISAKTRKKSK